MSTESKINLVDHDYRRRAQIAYMLSSEGRHVEPYDGLPDLARGQPGGGVWLVLDEEDLVSAVAQSSGGSDTARAIIAYATEPRLRRVVAAMTSGACDYLAWPATVGEVMQAIETAEGMALPRNARLGRSARARERVRRLTRREREILVSVAMGSTNREIANELGISHRTVEIHRSNMLTKLEAANSPDAVRIAFDAGLIN